MKQIIFLCGFMGCGKTTLGRMAADKLNLPFIDLDKQIEDTHKKSIAEMFSDNGENYFRMLETSAITSVSEVLSKKDGGIVALGGGAVIKPENVNIIKRFGILIFIDVEFEVCYERIKDNPARPLVKSHSREQLEQLYNERKPIYLKHALHTVKTPEAIYDYL